MTQPQSEPAQANQAEAMEILVGNILLIGVLLSVVLIAVGLVWSWIATRQLGLDYTLSGTNLFAFLALELRSTFSSTMPWQALIGLGVATLLLTPFVRVLASMLFFALAQRNWKYTAFTALVLGILIYSLFLVAR